MTSIPDSIARGLGCSGGGLSTRLHLVAGLRCRPVARQSGSGQHAGSAGFIPLLQQIRIRCRGCGRPRTRPGSGLAGEAYCSHGDRVYLRQRRITAVIAVQQDQAANRLARGSPRRPATRLRLPALPTAQHRRMLPQQAQRMPGRRHRLRQTRSYLPGQHRRRLDQDLAARPSPMIQPVPW